MVVPPLSFILFDAKGRIGRGTWIAVTVIYLITEMILNIALREIGGTTAPVLTGEDGIFLGFVRDEIDAALLAVFIGPQLTLDIKRWHDMGLSGWNTLWLYAPLAGMLALGAANVGGTANKPEPFAVIIFLAFMVVVIGYLVVLAIRPGTTGAGVALASNAKPDDEYCGRRPS